MKYIITLILSTVLTSSIFVVSCSHAKKAERGYKKFIKHGGKIGSDTLTVTITDTVKGVDGKDSIIYRTVNTICPELELPKTRYEIKWKYKYDIKLQKMRDAFVIDSMNKVNKLANIERKQIKFDKKTDKKKGWSYNLRFFAIIGFLIFLIVLTFKFKL